MARIRHIAADFRKWRKGYIARREGKLRRVLLRSGNPLVPAEPRWFRQDRGGSDRRADSDKALNDAGRWLPPSEPPPGLTEREYEEEGDPSGECRRYPPQHVEDAGWLFPLVRLDDGCGEWQKT